MQFYVRCCGDSTVYVCQAGSGTAKSRLAAGLAYGMLKTIADSVYIFKHNKSRRVE